MLVFHKGEIPFALLLLPFLAGLAWGAVYPTGVQMYTLIVFCAILFAFIILNYFYQPLGLYKAKWLGGFMVFTLLLFAGKICFDHNRQIDSLKHFSKKESKYLIGYISDEPKLSSGILRFTVKISQGGDTNKLQSLMGNLLVSVKLDTAHKIVLNYGDELLLPAKFTSIEGALNPAEFNYKAYLAHQNIYQQAFLIQYQVTVINHNKGNPIISKALQLRLNLVNKLKAAIKDTDAFAVASTIILGYRADLRREVQETYAKTGTMHLLSVAGMHVGLIYLMIAFVLNFLPHRKHTKLIKTFVFITLIWCYALITGFSPAVSRAALMLTTVIIGFSFNRHINRLNVLAVSAFILLFYNPFYILDAGFQLSYLAVFGIITIQPYIYNWSDVKNRLLREVWLVCSVSIAAQLILFPMGILYFHDFPVYFLVSNIFIIIPSAIIMYVGIAFLALPQIPYLSHSLGWLLEKTILLMTKTLAVIEHAPYGSIDKIWFTKFEFILAYAIIVGVFCLFVQKNKQWLKFIFTACLVIAVSFSVKAYRTNNSQSITFLSLRKNTGIVVRTGTNAILITDLQEHDKGYQYSVQPFLDSCGIKHLQKVALNHDTCINLFCKKGNLIQAGKKSVLIMDKSIAGKKFPQKLNTDYLYITNNSKTDLQYLKQNYNFKQLIAGGANLKRVIDTLQRQSLSAKINFLNLKSNKSIIFDSKN